MDVGVPNSILVLLKIYKKLKITSAAEILLFGFNCNNLSNKSNVSGPTAVKISWRGIGWVC